jgi:NADP-dependent 3-hydroxy acid dehydrogenase YdfG
MGRKLEGTVALVTGASSGIGEATALALAAEGAHVALAARRRDRLEALAERIAKLDVKTLVLESDITRADDATSVVEKTAAEFGRLDIVVNNAGVMLLGPVVGADPGEWQRMVDLNVNALLRVSLAALPHLLKAAESDPRNVADLINISSTAGRVARAMTGVYNLTKFGIGAFSEALRQEVTKRHVRVALVEPGATSTELLGHNRPGIQEQLRSRLGEIERLEAADIANAIVYVVTQPRHVAVNEILIRPTEQEY